MTRYVLRSAAAATVAALALAGCGDSNVGVAARVGDTEISTGTVTARVAASVDAGLIPANQRAGLQSAWVGQFVKSGLYREAARRLGVLPSRDELSRLTDEYIEDEGGLQQVEQVYSRQGVAPKYVRSLVETNVLYELVADALVRDIQKSEQELRKAYQERLDVFDLAEVAHINVGDKRTADDLVRQLRAGADFAALARDNSRDVQTAPQGGSLGVIGNGPGKFEPRIVQAIFAARPGSIVGPLPVRDGFEIIRVARRVTTPFEDVRDRLRRDLLGEERAKRMRDYLRDLARDLGVSVNPRFGRWDPTQVTVLEGRDTLSTTQPTPGAGPGAGGQGNPAPPVDEHGH